jgi:uncharacterized protein (DUF885 family)
MRFTSLVLIAALLPVSAGASDAALNEVLDAHWAYTLEQKPVLATSLGVRRYDDKLADMSLKAMDARKAQYQAFLADLDDIDTEDLSKEAALNHQLLEQKLRTDVAALSYPQRAMNFTRFSSWHLSFANLPDRVPLMTQADYESYVARLNAFPKQNAQALATVRAAIKNGMVHSCAALSGYEQSITAHIKSLPEQSRLWGPFDRDRPAFVDREAWSALKKTARASIDDGVMPALREWAELYRTQYLPACRQEVGAATLERGEDYYTHRIKRYTTTDLSARQIHQIGLSEVSRIRREMRSIMDRVKFRGRFSEFLTFLRTDPRFYAKTPEELLGKTALIAKQADGALPAFFGHLPRMPYTVKAIPAEIAPGYTTAYYEQPSGDGTRAGVYRINLTSLDQRPLFELEALILHEAVPGHHLQIALRQERQDLPDFRRYGGYTAFSEGWGLYAERLGKEMGFFTDPYADFGRLSYEMWRACRLVVDTGMHTMGWSRQRAIDFMADNTALSQTNIDAEVDRYITWPGQALAYKIGELKIRAIRKLASETLGPGFDIRAFHDALLADGGLPLSILEDRMRDWIRAQGGILPERRKPQEERGKRRPANGQGGRPPQ